MRVILLVADGVAGYAIRPVSKRVIQVMEKQAGDSTIRFQADWEYPLLASALGWNLRSRWCGHPWTDGTVTCCDCGKTVEDFIAEAAQWLHEREGQVFQGTNADDFVLNALGIESPPLGRRHVVSSPGILGGKHVSRETRVSVEHAASLLRKGVSHSQSDEDIPVLKFS